LFAANWIFRSTDKTICVTAATAAARGKPVCVVTLADYVMVHGKLPGEETNASVGTGGVSKTPFGWRELDGLVRSFATDESENVYVGDSVSVFAEVHINLCYSWCVYAATNRHTRVVSILCKKLLISIHNKWNSVVKNCTLSARILSKI